MLVDRLLGRYENVRPMMFDVDDSQRPSWIGGSHDRRLLWRFGGDAGVVLGVVMVCLAYIGLHVMWHVLYLLQTREARARDWLRLIEAARQAGNRVPVFLLPGARELMADNNHSLQFANAALLAFMEQLRVRTPPTLRPETAGLIPSKIVMEANLEELHACGVESCIICYEDFEVDNTVCELQCHNKHVFHRHCI